MCVCVLGGFGFFSPHHLPIASDVYCMVTGQESTVREDRSSRNDAVCTLCIYFYKCVWDGKVLNLQRREIWKPACKLPGEGTWINHGKNITAEEETLLKGNSARGGEA